MEFWPCSVVLSKIDELFDWSLVSDVRQVLLTVSTIGFFSVTSDSSSMERNLLKFNGAKKFKTLEKKSEMKSTRIFRFFALIRFTLDIRHLRGVERGDAISRNRSDSEKQKDDFVN